jgi:Membrane protein putatively involved in post-translational modification of the autoinducing quorum-sensing peptide
MLDKLSGKIVEVLKESGLIAKEDTEIYLFGVEVALLKLIHFATMLIVGFCFGMALETVVFIVSYSLLRVYAGGFHAETRLGCYGISWFMILFTLFLTKFCPALILSTVAVIFFIPSFLIIFILAPVENKNKPLDITEKYRYRKITRVMLFAELIIWVILLCINIVQVAFIISISLFSLAIMLLLGKLPIAKSE